MKKKKFEKTLIIQKNSMIDKNLVEKAEAFEKKLSEYGENTKSRYTLTPPLNTTNEKFLLGEIAKLKSQGKVEKLSG